MPWSVSVIPPSHTPAPPYPLLAFLHLANSQPWLIPMPPTLPGAPDGEGDPKAAQQSCHRSWFTHSPSGWLFHTLLSLLKSPQPSPLRCGVGGGGLLPILLRKEKQSKENIHNPPLRLLPACFWSCVLRLLLLWMGSALSKGTPSPA